MYKWLFVIVFIAFLFRVPNITQIPVGFTPDEASFGYDAYSLLLTGRDQWGRAFPLVLESFGDFKAPLYTYLTVPFVWIFGLTKFAVRLPNALIGVAAVLATYFLTSELLNLNKYVKQKFTDINAVLPTLASLFVAISPWHIMMSRGAFEANLTTFFLPLGVFLFLKGLRLKSSPNMLLASIFLGLNLFSYHAARLVTPLIGISLVILFFGSLRNMGWKKLTPAIFFVLLFSTLVGVTFYQGAGRRASDVSIANGALEAQADARLLAINSGQSPVVARLLHNKYIVIADRFLDNYKSYWSIDFLIKNGPREATYGMIPGIGVMSVLEGILLLFFVVAVIARRNQKAYLFIIFWLLVGFLPASLTTGVGHAANRAEVILPALPIALAFGMGFFLTVITKFNLSRKKVWFGFALVVCVFVNAVNTIYDYYKDSPVKSAKAMLYGNLEAAGVLSKHAASDIVVSRSLSEPHIYIAFSHVWDPADYQKHTLSWQSYKELGLSFLDQLPTYSLGKYTFRSINNPDNPESTPELVLGRPEEFALGIRPVETFYYPDGSLALYIVNTKQNKYASR